MKKNQWVVIGTQVETGKLVYYNQSGRWSEPKEIAYRFIRRQDAKLFAFILERNDKSVHPVSIFAYED